MRVDNSTLRGKASSEVFWRVIDGTEVEIKIKNKRKASKLPTTMFKNHIKIALRNLIRKKGFTLINISGLAVGMAASVLIMIWIQFEYSVDSNYEKSDRIYAVWRSTVNQGDVLSWDYTPTPYAPVLKDQYPEVEAVTHVTEWDPMVLAVGEKSFYEQTSFVDPGFFEMFNFKVLEGDPVEALKSPDNIVLTESVAKKLFGNESALGKSVKCRV